MNRRGFITSLATSLAVAGLAPRMVLESLRLPTEPPSLAKAMELLFPGSWWQEDGVVSGYARLQGEIGNIRIGPVYYRSDLLEKQSVSVFAQELAREIDRISKARGAA